MFLGRISFLIGSFDSYKEFSNYLRLGEKYLPPKASIKNPGEKSSKSSKKEVS
jgi:hypothetical protein